MNPRTAIARLRDDDFQIAATIAAKIFDKLIRRRLGLADDENRRSPGALSHALHAEAANSLHQRRERLTVIRSTLPRGKALPRQPTIVIQAVGKRAEITRRGRGNQPVA